MENKKESMLRGAVLLLSAGFLIYGLWRGEAEVVLGKAVTICLQCIGLG